jgi:hypothetical protein
MGGRPSKKEFDRVIKIILAFTYLGSWRGIGYSSSSGYTASSEERPHG